MVRAAVLVLAACGGAAGAVAAQDPGSDRRATLPEPRPLLFPRGRAGWVPLAVTLENRDAARRTARWMVEDSLQGQTVRTVLDAELEPGARVQAVGYVWGTNQRWQGSQSCVSAKLVGPRGAWSPDARLLRPPGDAWQVAVMLNDGPGGSRLPPRVSAAASPEGVRPLSGPRPPPQWTMGPGGVMVPVTAKAAADPAPVDFDLWPMGPGECPTHVVGWDPCDLLVVSTRAALDDLSLAERTAVLQWVALGGVVLVDAGEPATDCERPLVAALVGGRPGPSRVLAPPVPGEFDLSERGRVAAVLPPEPQPVLPPPAGFRTLETWDGTPVLAWRPHGHGLVYWCGADCTRRRGRAPPDLGPVLERVLQHARARQARRLEPLGDRWPGQPPGEARYAEVAPPSAVGNQWSGWRGYGVDTAATQATADALHTGRERMPSPAAVVVFLSLYLAALGPGVWWLRRRWGGGLVGIPVTLGVALVFMAGAIAFGLVTRGLALVTQRVTFLWPVPGLPLAAESTWCSLYAGLGQRVTVRFPGQVAPLTVDRQGRFGTAGGLAVRFGTEATEAVDFALGAWQTRVLCAEGARAIGGPVTVSGAVGPGGRFTVLNHSALPLGRGLIWWLGTSLQAPVAPIAPGDRVSVAALGDAGEHASVERHFGLPGPGPSDRRQGLLALVRAARSAPAVDEHGAVVESAGGVVYVAEVDPAALPGGGPTVAGERRITDRVFVVVPVRTDGGDE